MFGDRSDAGPPSHGHAGRVPSTRDARAQRAWALGIAVGVGAYLGAVIGASVAVLESCEPDYPMLCELGALFGAGVGLPIGAIAVGVAVAVAVRGTKHRAMSALAALVVVGSVAYLIWLRIAFPNAFRNVLVQNGELWVVASVILFVATWLIGLMWSRGSAAPSARSERVGPVR